MFSPIGCFPSRTALALAMLLVLAGCAGGGSSDEQTVVKTVIVERTPEPTPTAIETPTAAPTVAQDVDAVSADEVRRELERQGVDVNLFRRANTPERGYVLSYTTRQTTQSGIATEMGFVAGVWAAFVDANDDTGEGLIVEVTAVDGEPIGYYEIKTAWAEEYMAGEISGEAYSALVLLTLEAVED